jgi:hypothetical protein
MLMGAREAPSAISDLLRRYWTHHLALVILRDGTDSERFAQARRSGEQLWQVMLDCESGHPRRTDLTPLLEPVLASSGVTGPTALETIHTVEALLDAMHRGDRERIESSVLPSAPKPAAAHDDHVVDSFVASATQSSAPESYNVVQLRSAAEALSARGPGSEAAVESSGKPVVTERGTEAHFASFWGPSEEQAESESGAPGADSSATTESGSAGESAVASESPVASTLPPAAEAPPVAAAVASFEPADLEKVRKLEVGSWVEMIGEDGTPQPAKLSWVSPISNRLLFVNRRGMRVCALSAEELATMLAQGKLGLREIDTAFERAMSQVLGKLRDTRGPATATDV